MAGTQRSRHLRRASAMIPGLLTTLIVLEPVLAIAMNMSNSATLHLPSQEPPQSHLSPLINPQPLSQPLNNQTLHLPANNDYIFTCSGSTYGSFHSSEITSCLDATEAINTGRERYRFAMRGSPEYDEDTYPLPWRWMDSKLYSQFCRLAIA